MHGMIWTGKVAAILFASLLGSATWVGGATGDDVRVAANHDAGAAMALRGDTVPASPQWTLEEALVRSLEVAPRIGQWTANREAAEAGADWLSSPYLPTISAGASLSRSRFPTTVTPIREPGTFPPLSDEIREASISVAWTVFDFGRGREGRLAARTLAEAAGSREEQARMETLETVTDHFIQLAALEGVRMAEQARLASIRETEAQVRALVDEGRLPRVDQLRLTELLLEAQADLRSTEEDLRRLAGSLSTELSLEAPLLPDAVRVPELRADLLPPPLPPLQNPRGPLVGAAEARLEAADHQARESRRALSRSFS
jgi:outer membrane protein TolC